MTEINDRLKLWNQVEKTDIRYTKTGRLDGRGVTSINPIYMVKQATIYLGRIGIDWGYEIKEERFDRSTPVINEQGMELGCEIMHTIQLELWYKDGDDIGRLVHYGHTPYVRKTKYGLSTDWDAPKKSLTDAIKKCLSMLGFNADIFMGEFEDIDYVNQRQQESAIEHAENKESEREKQHQIYIDEMKELVKLIDEAKTIGIANGVYKKAIRKADLRQDNKMIIRINKSMEATKARLEAQKDTTK